MSYLITNPNSFPYSAVCSIIVTYPDGVKAEGSGCLVNVNNVLTATHVLYSPLDGGWVTNIKLVFGSNFNPQSGLATTSVYTVDNSTNGAFNLTAFQNQVFSGNNGPLDNQLSFAQSAYDVGIIGLRIPVGDYTGWFGMSAGYNAATSAYSVGYPGTVGVSTPGTGLMRQDITVTSNNGQTYNYSGTDTLGPGSSGGPLIANDGTNNIIGVTSAGINGVQSTWADIGNTWNNIQQTLTVNALLVSPPVPVITANTPQNVLAAPAANVTVSGAGLDIINLSNKVSAAYTLTSNGDSSFNLSTTGSTNHVVGVIQVQFADKTMTIAATNSIYEQVALLYQGALNRSPDASGLAFWEKSASALPATLQAISAYSLSDYPSYYNGKLSIAGGFTNSFEFSNKYGNLNNSQFATQLYANTLDRTPDSGGLAFWTSALDSGVSREHVLVGFADSAEAISNATMGFVGRSGTHSAWLFLT